MGVVSLREAGETLAARADFELHKIRNNPSLVRSFFGHACVAYISD